MAIANLARERGRGACEAGRGAGGVGSLAGHPAQTTRATRSLPREERPSHRLEAALSHQAAIPLPAAGPRMARVARILIVEDEQADQIILGNIVGGAGHEVFFASGSEQAVEMSVGKGIDVVVTDLHMPKIDGLELIRVLRAAFPNRAVIAVSGKGRRLLAAAEKLGVFAALSKPVDPDELLMAIARTAPENYDYSKGGAR